MKEWKFTSAYDRYEHEITLFFYLLDRDIRISKKKITKILYNKYKCMIVDVLS